MGLTLKRKNFGLNKKYARNLGPFWLHLRMSTLNIVFR